MTAHRRSKSAPFKVWAGVALIALALALLPFVAALAGQAWVRILNFAMIYIMLALGLNIVVGFAGLLDLGYIAFYAVGAYMYALLASPHFSIHLPFSASRFPVRRSTTTCCSCSRSASSSSISGSRIRDSAAPGRQSARTRSRPRRWASTPAT